uniref:quinone oxidoreductase PIG3-like isoform X1 n=1 Tax=Fragaria vesca subsp. vesca TaxID=101020 RepID=UPI0005CAB570|nr:PREDICTED: quinone oxidoreductase PIG3-like isoform X1 [Fragaria vesca subsp. vesca]
MMKAILARVTGPPEVLEVVEVAEPQLEDNEVLIRVAAAGMNEPDVTERQRSLPPQASLSILGLECSGTIEKVGKNVERWKIGQEVCAVLRGGGYGEKVAVPEGHVFRIPKNISLEEAASFPQVACSVWVSLFTRDKLNSEYWLPLVKDGSRTSLSVEKIGLMTRMFFRGFCYGITKMRKKRKLKPRDHSGNRRPQFAWEIFLGAIFGYSAVFVVEKKLYPWFPGSRSRLIAGESILVHGGSGGIGSFVVQLAKALRVNVIVTVSSCNKFEFCRRLGANACISFNYKDKKDGFSERVREETNNRGVDVVLSNLPVQYIGPNNACVKVGGTVIQIGLCWMLPYDTKNQLPQPKKVGSVLQENNNVGVAGFRYRPIEEKTRIVNEVERNVWPLIERQEVKPVVQHRFPFSRASDAHRLMESGMHLGKILLIPDDRFDNNWLLALGLPNLPRRKRFAEEKKDQKQGASCTGERC